MILVRTLYCIDEKTEAQKVKHLSLASLSVAGREWTRVWGLSSLLLCPHWTCVPGGPGVITGALSLLPHPHGQSKPHSQARLKAREVGSTSWQEELQNPRNNRHGYRTGGRTEDILAINLPQNADVSHGPDLFSPRKQPQVSHMFFPGTNIMHLFLTF